MEDILQNLNLFPGAGIKQVIGLSRVFEVLSLAGFKFPKKTGYCDFKKMNARELLNLAVIIKDNHPAWNKLPKKIYYIAGTYLTPKELKNRVQNLIDDAKKIRL